MTLREAGSSEDRDARTREVKGSKASDELEEDAHGPGQLEPARLWALEEPQCLVHGLDWPFEPGTGHAQLVKERG